MEEEDYNLKNIRDLFNKNSDADSNNSNNEEECKYENTRDKGNLISYSNKIISEYHNNYYNVSNIQDTMSIFKEEEVNNNEELYKNYTNINTDIKLENENREKSSKLVKSNYKENNIYNSISINKNSHVIKNNKMNKPVNTNINLLLHSDSNNSEIDFSDNNSNVLGINNSNINKISKTNYNKTVINKSSSDDSEYETESEEFIRLKIDNTVKLKQEINKIKRLKSNSLKHIHRDDYSKLEEIHHHLEHNIFPGVSITGYSESLTENGNTDNKNNDCLSSLSILGNEYYYNELPEIGTNLFFQYQTNDLNKVSLKYIGKGVKYYNTTKMKSYSMRKNLNYTSKNNLSKNINSSNDISNGELNNTNIKENKFKVEEKTNKRNDYTINSDIANNKMKFKKETSIKSNITKNSFDSTNILNNFNLYNDNNIKLEDENDTKNDFKQRIQLLLNAKEESSSRNNNKEEFLKRKRKRKISYNKNTKNKTNSTVIEYKKVNRNNIN